MILIRIHNILAICFLLSTALVFGGQEEKILRLQIGDETLRTKTMAVSAGKIYAANTGESISFSEMIEEMAQSRLVYVGETHNSLPMHQIQAKIIQGLYEQDRDITVGLEMYPITQQEPLNKWSLGILSEEEFIREGQWYVNWNFHFGFYRDVFAVVKKNAVPLYALNVPRNVITKVRMRGWKALSEEEKEMVPELDLTHQDHRTLIRTVFESSDLPPQMKGKGLEMAFEGLYRAQTAWDETMAHHALSALHKEGGKIVVLAGSGHLLYNLGINLRAHKKSQMPFKTVVCVVIPQGEQSVKISCSLADYVWGIAEEGRPAYPSVGLRFKKFDGLDNLVIERDPIDGVAKGSDFKRGDVVLLVDGKKHRSINELRMYLAQFTWGDRVAFQLLRDAKEVEVILDFQMADVDSEYP
ncbi:MAG: ChaN family lipoprotein [Candidatus Aminicenantes bacterium]|nr:MAG: ChaN family lipoprotein [Candidatus Aminicenantes bacterium]